jgi:AcrR family transcriptional regulator
MALPSDKGQPEPDERRSRGRPRDSATEHSMLGAAADILRDEGLEGFSISAVAARSGSSRTTVYRRWRSRDVLLLEALAEVFAADQLSADGHLLAILKAIARDRRDVMRDRVFLAALPLVVQLSVSRKGLSSQAKQQLLTPYRDAFVHSYQDLAARRQVRSDADPDLLLSMLLGAILYRIILSQKVGSRELGQLSMLIVAAVEPVRAAP